LAAADTSRRGGCHVGPAAAGPSGWRGPVQRKASQRGWRAPGAADTSRGDWHVGPAAAGSGGGRVGRGG